MTSTDYRHNHYVPEWYQRRFMLSGQTKYHRLDLHPDVVTSPGGHKYMRHDLHEWSPEKIQFRSPGCARRIVEGRCSKNEPFMGFLAHRSGQRIARLLHEVRVGHRRLEMLRFAPSEIEWRSSAVGEAEHACAVRNSNEPSGTDEGIDFVGAELRRDKSHGHPPVVPDDADQIDHPGVAGTVTAFAHVSSPTLLFSTSSTAKSRTACAGKS